MPGTPLPGGMVTLPLNWDVLTNLVVAYINTSLFTNFMGTLNANGKASATLNFGPLPGTAGISMYYAYLLKSPFNFVSTPVMIDIVP